MIGKTISHYRILEKLGEGGMGVVYKAQDTKLDRTVALKFLPPELMRDSDARMRFFHEAKAAAALSHPNICTVHEIDEAEGQIFIATECVEGETLKQKIESGPMRIDAALRIVIQIAEGLQEAHEKGVVHRDIKSANIMVTPRGQAKIMDFGLAKLRGVTQVTKAGTTVGTIGYMSPEQARGGDTDHRTDIWSLGVVLYEMVTGQLPFRGDYAEAVVYSILNETPEPVTALRTGVPMELERIIEKAMAKRREERYQQVNEMLVDLRSASMRAASDRAPHTAGMRVSKRRRWVMLAAGLAGLIAITILLTQVLLVRPDGVIDSIAVLPLENLSGDPEQEYFADGMTDALIASLAKISSLKVISRTSVMRFKESDKSLPEIARALNVRAVVEGTVILTGDRVRVTAQLIRAPTDEHLWAESYDRDLGDILELQSELARAIAKEIHVRLSPQDHERFAAARQLDPEVYQLYLKGRYYWNKRTEEGFQRAIDYFEQAIEKDPAYAPAYSGLADTYALFSSWGMVSPDEVLPKAKAAALKAVELDSTLAEARVSLATVREIEWDWEGAGREYRRAIELNPSYATAHHWYGLHLSELGSVDEALVAAKRARDLDPLSLIINASVAWHLITAGRHDEAIEELHKALDMDPDFEATHQLLGAAFAEKGLYERAIEELERAVTVGGPLSESAATLGYVYGVAGMDDKARNILKEFDDSSEEKYVAPYFYAVIYSGLGDEKLAFESLERAFRERDPWIVQLKTDPRFRNLRDDPRFSALVRKIGLES
ncbi:MAG: protein kinase [Candidatus Eiseniibacteriota bacterium]|nr:MAG: protein kinase [Candidatus Eisenbacteria bacterium]